MGEPEHELDGRDTLYRHLAVRSSAADDQRPHPRPRPGGGPNPTPGTRITATIETMDEDTAMLMTHLLGGFEC